MTKEYKGLLGTAMEKGGVPVLGRITIPNTETYKVGDNYIKVGAEVVYEWAYNEGADYHDVNIAMIAYARAEADYILADDKEKKGITKTQAVAKAPEPAGEPAFGPPDSDIVNILPTTANDAPEPIEIAKFKLEKRTQDDLLMLQLYPLLGDGRIGKYAELKMVASREKLWGIMEGAMSPSEYSFQSLPVEYECSWLAFWEHGKEYTGKDGSTKRYKDLVRLEAR
ncbi:MAG: hypothetical protein ACXACD_22455 [Candidatus Thorarchaeota archaeon]|jgi:hypothetical protein